MASDKQLYEAHREGWTYRQITDRFGFESEDGVRSRVGRYARKQFQSLPDTVPFPIVARGSDSRHQIIPKIIQMPVLRSPLLVFADVHVPTTEWTMFELMCKFAEKHLPKGARTGALVGDLFNLDAISQYDHIIAPYSIQTEMDYAEGAIEYLLAVLDTLYISMGNHDYRLFKLLAGDFGATRLGKMITKHVESGRVVMTDKSQMVAIQAGHIWRLTHQRNYSRIKGRVASDLAIKHQCNVITHHEHHVAVLRDTYNRYTAINNGALVDYEKLVYVQLVDSTSGVMCNGFTYLSNGVGHLLTPYDTMTDWDIWGLGSAALFAIEAAKLKMERLTMPIADVLPVATVESEAA